MLEKITRFDWYQSSVQVKCPQESGLVDVLLKAWEFSDWAPARNRNGYTNAGAIVRGERILCHVAWGGQNGVNCTSTSDESPVLAQAIRDFGHQHLPTRIDSCIDWCEEGLFDSLSAELIRYAGANRLSIDQRGDWVRGEGRSLYIGSDSSVARLVLYEKGAERRSKGFFEAPLDWVRLEARLKPARPWRAIVSHWSSDTVFEAAWFPGALQALGWGDLSKRSVGIVWKPSDAQRARTALCKQYGNVLLAWMAEAGGSEELGVAVVDLVRLIKSGPVHGLSKSTVD